MDDPMARQNAIVDASTLARGEAEAAEGGKFGSTTGAEDFKR
jgi:hypothetical protein